MSANTFRRDLDELMQLCDIVEETFIGCDYCPLQHDCLKESTIEEVWCEVSEKRIQEFIDYAENIDEELYRIKLEREQEQREYEEEMRELYRGWRADRGI